VELWSPRLDASGAYLKLLEVFDHVFVFNGRTVEAIAERTGRPCSFIPTATDTLCFSPFPFNRSIDVYAMGRSSVTAHRQLVSMSDRRELFYLFANVNHQLPDYRAHRVLVASRGAGGGAVARR